MPAQFTPSTPSPIDRYRAAILAAEEEAEGRFNVGEEDEALIGGDLATAESEAYSVFEDATADMERLANATPTATQAASMMMSAAMPLLRLAR